MDVLDKASELTTNLGRLGRDCSAVIVRIKLIFNRPVGNVERWVAEGTAKSTADPLDGWRFSCKCLSEYVVDLCAQEFPSECCHQIADRNHQRCQRLNDKAPIQRLAQEIPRCPRRVY